MSTEDRRSLPVLSVDEALALVLESVSSGPPVEVALDAAAGRWLAEEIRAGSDMPPFDRTAMDGYAVRAADAAAAPVELEVIEEIPAGREPRSRVGPGKAARIMTGACVPDGADAVVMVENTEALDGGARVRLMRPAERGRHIRRKGEEIRRGERLLGPGTRIGAAECALLAAEGRLGVRVHALPTVALLSTGDELVPAEAAAQGSRIRETNSWSLRTLLRRMGIEPRLLGIARDEAREIREKIGEGLRADALVVTGGVSMGEYDLVGECLRQAGCRPRFERVAIQPGKPLFFGRAGGGTVIFGLPGNPVSSVVDLLVFVRPALRKMAGDPLPSGPLASAVLEEGIRRRPGRRGYLPARAAVDPSGGIAVRAVPTMGSADLVALSRANALLVAPEDRAEIPAGESVRILPLEGGEDWPLPGLTS